MSEQNTKKDDDIGWENVEEAVGQAGKLLTAVASVIGILGLLVGGNKKSK